MKISPLLALPVFAPCAVLAQTAQDVIPMQATHCAINTPPPAAGLAATPGGFVMVFPRDDALPKDYTGCKLMWIVNGEQRPRFATLYFDNGKLAVAAAHNVRDAAGRLDAACAYPQGKSLLPDAGRQIKDSGCAAISKEGFYQLYVPTWPATCLSDPKAAACQREPN